MPGIDKAAMRAQTQAALQGQQGAAPAPAAAPAVAPAPQQPRPSMAQQAATQVAQAALAATTGQPATAAAAQPSQPGAPGGKPSSIEARIAALKEASGDRIPVRFNHGDMDLPVSETLRFAQIGMAAEDIQKQRADLKADKAGYEGYRAFQRWVEADQTGMRARLLQDAYTGRVDPARIYSQDADDSPLGHTSPAGDTRGHTSQGDPATQTRIGQLEQQLQALKAQTDQRTFEQRLETSLNNHDYLKGDAGAIQLAHEIVMGRLAAPDFQTLEAEVARAASRVKTYAESKLEALRERREEQAREFIPVTPGRGPALPKLPDTLLPGTRGMRSQQNKGAVKEWLASFGRAVNSGPQ